MRRNRIGKALLAVVLLVGCEDPEEEPTSAASPTPTGGSGSGQAESAREGAAQGHGGGTSAAAAGDPGTPAAGGLTWTAPAVFEPRRTESRMRAAEYVVRTGDDEEAELAVYYFGPDQGGSVEANVDRWVGQFQPPDGSDGKDAAQVDKRSIRGMDVTTVQTRGTYHAMQMPGAPAAAPATDHRLLGAIVEGPQGMVFFKLVGPASAVDEAEDGFRELLESLEPAG